MGVFKRVRENSLLALTVSEKSNRKISIQVKIAKKLLKVCPDMENWGKINMAEKPTSLSWFLTEEGREFLVLAEKRRKLDLDTKKTYSLSENKIGKDPTVKSKKPKSTLDFLNSNL